MILSDAWQLLRVDDRGGRPPARTGRASAKHLDAPGTVPDDQSRHVATCPVLDPALLAFVKCHVTSCAKWDVLRPLPEQVGDWADPVQLVCEVGRPLAEVRSVLDELRDEGILETA